MMTTAYYARKKSLKERLGVLGVGILVSSIVNNSFDYLLYPAVMWYFGTFLGGGIMWAASFAACYGLIRFYDWSKKDWLGIETLKEVREADARGRFFHKALQWAMRRGDWMVMILISINFDPFMCTVYMRHGAHKYNGMTKRDWQIFVISFIIANLWWSIAVLTGLEVGEWIIGAIRS